MLKFPHDTKNEQKCDVTHGAMGHLDPQQPPVKRKPFSAILTHPFVNKVELVLPSEIYEIVANDLCNPENKPTYSRVILPLKALVEGEFFNQYIKIGLHPGYKSTVAADLNLGNIMMLSEGNSGTDNVYSLREGILTLHLDKESYQRAGIEGKPEGVKGKRGTKPRWIVEINLRLPSMLHGKKGFDRIIYAFKNVFNKPVTWLFHDLGKTALTPDPLATHFPIKKTSALKIYEDIKANLPNLNPPTAADSFYGEDFEDYAIEIHEWLALLVLESPRMEPNDNIDPFLSRYATPAGATTPCTLVRLTWQGFISPMWAHKTFVQLLLAIPREAWFAYVVTGFSEGWSGDCKSSTILKLPDASVEYMLWEIS